MGRYKEYKNKQKIKNPVDFFHEQILRAERRQINLISLIDKIYIFIKRNILEFLEIYQSFNCCLIFNLFENEEHNITLCNNSVSININFPLWNKYLEYLKEKYPDQIFEYTPSLLTNLYTEEIMNTLKNVFKKFQIKHPKWDFLVNGMNNFTDINKPSLNISDNYTSWEFFWN